MSTKRAAILFAFIAWTSGFAAAALFRAGEGHFGGLMVGTSVASFMAMMFAVVAYLEGKPGENALQQRALDAEKERDEWLERYLVLEQKLANKGIPTDTTPEERARIAQEGQDMTTFVRCDRCGEEAGDTFVQMSLREETVKPDPARPLFVTPDTVKDYDLCARCAKKVEKLMDYAEPDSER